MLLHRNKGENLVAINQGEPAVCVEVDDRLLYVARLLTADVLLLQLCHVEVLQGVERRGLVHR